MATDVLSTDTALAILLCHNVADASMPLTIKQVIEVAAEIPNGLGAGLLTPTALAWLANNRLARFGMRVFAYPDGTYLFVGNSPDTDLRLVFPTGFWQNGAWKQSLIRLPGARMAGLKTIADSTMRGIEIPLSTVLNGQTQ